MSYENISEEEKNSIVYTPIERKAGTWECESEIRFVKNSDSDAGKVEFIPYAAFGLSVSAIYFGCRTSKENKDIIKNLLNIKNLNPKVLTYEMREDEKSTYELKELPC
jgi:hypothetical protein